MGPVPGARQGFIERTEYEQLLDKVPDWFKPVFTFAFQTGWRKEEILGLQWEHIDMKERQITLPGRRSKSGHARPIYADDVVYQILKEQRREQFEDGARTFPLPVPQTTWSFDTDRACPYRPDLMTNMRERVIQMKGKLQIVTSPNEGTRIIVAVTRDADVTPAPHG